MKRVDPNGEARKTVDAALREPGWTAPDHDARVELNAMLDAIKRDAPDYFRIGKMAAKKMLSNGASVHVVITMPDKGTETP
jgi:hypothetical protein